MNQDSRERHDEPRHFRIRFTWVLAGFLAVAAYFLFTEHRAHAISYLPFVLLALCPLMHLFHRHGGHGGHGERDGEGEAQGSPPNARAPHQHPPGDHQ